MVEQFKKKLRTWKKGCDYCPKQIIMKEQPDGKWKPFETDGTTYHKCNPKEAYKTIPSNEVRDKQMAPKQPNINDPVTHPAPPPKDVARKAWEEENKVLREKITIDQELQEVSFLGEEDQIQILITELTKHTHLLEAILEKISK